MRIILLFGIVTGLPVFGLALRAHWHTSLRHALLWAISAWMAWGIAFFLGAQDATTLEPGRFCALALTGCAGVAVLGARRPYVFAWNFVGMGLFLVMVLPLLETLVIGTHPVDGLRITFLASTILVGGLNYLPTKLGPASVVMMAACAGQLVSIYAPAWLPGRSETTIFDGMLVVVPWLGWLGFGLRGNADRSDFDRIWLRFRDSWGLVWSQRVREQFNHAAKNAGWAVSLHWRGLNGKGITAVDQEKYVATLRATVQRFLESKDQ